MYLDSDSTDILNLCSLDSETLEFLQLSKVGLIDFISVTTWIFGIQNELADFFGLLDLVVIFLLFGSIGSLNYPTLK